MGQGRGGQLLGCLGSDQPRLQSAWERHAGLCVSAADLTKMVALLHSVDLAHQGMGSIRTHWASLTICSTSDGRGKWPVPAESLLAVQLTG